MRNRKEEYLKTLLCQPSKDMPFYAPPYRAPLGFMDEIEKGPAGGGKDGFGVIWEVTPEGPIPSCSSFLLEDIADWEKVIRFPDLESVNWKEKVEREMANWDRENQVVEYGMGNAHFERLVALMGFENGLCALLEDPESCAAYMEAFTDYRIRYIQKIAQYYHPDIICSYDDVAHVRGTFMSRDVYQELIKPYHIAVNDACKRLGIIPIQHCCGKAESLIEDFIDEGARCWTSVQPCNDIAGLLEKYGDRISLCGGFDTTKLASMPSLTEADIRAEVADTARRYGKRGSFIMGNFTLMGGGFTKQEISRIIADEALKIGDSYYG